MLQSRQVKFSPQDSINELIIWKNESLSRSRNQREIQIGIPACVMSSEYFTRTSLYNGQICKSLSGQNCLKDVNINYSGKLSC